MDKEILKSFLLEEDTWQENDFSENDNEDVEIEDDEEDEDDDDDEEEL